MTPPGATGREATVDTDTWVEAALDSESGRLSELIASLPPSGIQVQAATLADTSALDTRVYALRAVSQEHSVGGDPQLAFALARAGMLFCMKSFESHGSGPADCFLFGVGQFAIDAQRACDRLDAHGDQLAVIEEALEWLATQQAGDEHVRDLRFARIEAQIELGSLEAARRSLDQEAFRGHSKHPLFGLLDLRIRDRLKAATALRDQRDAEEQAAEQREASLSAALDGLGSISPEFASVFRNLEQQLNADVRDTSTKTTIERANRFYEHLGGLLENQAEGSGTQFRLNATLQRVSAVLADERRGRDPEQLRRMAKRLEATREEALTEGLEDTAEDALWPIYICHKRLGNLEPGLAALQTIRQVVKTRRAKIADPLKRAGIAQGYPHLYVELCARFAQKGDDASLLTAIEEAKGRALHDMLATEAAREDAPWPEEEAAAWLPGYVAELDIHYLTYLCDDDRCHALLIGRDGSLHSASLPIGEADLRRLRRNIDPSSWGKPDGIFGRHPDDLPQQLAPLVAWLGPHVDSGLIREGDHICYAPDGLLHLVPLHYVEFRGAPLVRHCSLSRTHCAALLWQVTQGEACLPGQHLAVMVPSEDEQQGDPEKIEQLARVPRWMTKYLDAETLCNEEADLTALAQRDLRGTLLHFATHGRFPDPGTRRNPYEYSGIVLSEDGRLPVKGSIQSLLSPQWILERRDAAAFEASHVTLQACVSGLSEEGIGGDALGMEWSLLMAGARSVLSTHWNVPAGSSADFSIRFYELWLQEGMSRGEAWRQAMLSMMDEAPFEAETALNWAPFSLAGDWR